MKKFFGEFKKFITRGNVLDMSVGVIVGGAFTAIVNGMSNFILKPIVCLGKNALSEMYTFLVEAFKTDEAGNTVRDLANSIYIDWGSFINAVINFLLTAIVLFCIVKIINGVKERDKKFKESMQPVISKEDRIAMKKLGIKSKDTVAIKAYFDEKAAKEAAEKAAAEEKARLEREANPTTEDLLKKILAVLEKN